MHRNSFFLKFSFIIYQSFLYHRFCERAQALIHGDLHTGSVMVTPNSTQVIDPEFAFYGPMGFDIGAFVGNLILAFFAQDGHAAEGNDRKVCLCIFLSSLCFHSLFLFSSYWVSFCLSVCLYHPRLPPCGGGGFWFLMTIFFRL